MTLRVVFSSAHALPHIADIGVSPRRVEAAIEQQVIEDCARASLTGYFWGRLVVQGVLVEYRTYTLPDGSLNVGTYYKARPA